MLRSILLLAVVVVASVLVRAEGDPSRPTNAALVQIEDCLDMRVTSAPNLQAASPDKGLSVQGLGAMLGIGVLTMMFFVPAALLSELLMRRNSRPDSAEATWERSWK